MTEKTFKSMAEQIELLKSKSLTIIDEADVASKLSDFGYYEIINGYRDTFRNTDKTYKTGTTLKRYKEAANLAQQGTRVISPS